MNRMFNDAKTQIFFIGDIIPTKKYIYLLEEGLVSLSSKSSSSTSDHIIFVYKKGEVFPAAPLKKELLSGRKPVFVAQTVVTVKKILRKDFDAEIYKQENIHKYVNYLINLLELHYERLDNYEQGVIQKRVIERIHYMAVRFGKKNGDEVIVEGNYSHSGFAMTLGTTRETINRVMKDLEKMGIVSIRDKNLVVRSHTKLIKLMKDTNKCIEKN